MTLPRLGTIRTHENTRKLQRRIGNGTARILSATVRQERGRWLVSFQVEVKREIIRVSRPGVAVGVDLGVKVLAVMADSAGEIRYVPNPAHYDTALKALRRLSRRVSRRRGPDQRTGQQPSKRWLAADAERNRVHHRVANLRADALHKLTTGLARKIADAGFGEIRRQITYKAGWDSGTVIVANRWYPSSRACSFCGARSGRRPGRTSAETAWSRPEDPRQPGQPQGRSRAGR
ncbi:transposase [Nonomuraea wenchangensis]|uniref:transposase n=1 Tax=Nonomuraea wenchangensis TaxID=568860 RepID=UPI001C430C67|nr:transposase [Nonomuraea wenchangensis]